MQIKFFSKKLFSGLKTQHKAPAFTVSASEYYCLHCNQKFSTYWDIRANKYNSFISRGSFVLCPYCGKTHHQNLLYIKQDEYAPSQMQIKINEFKNKVVLQIDYLAQSFTQEMFKIQYKQFREIFTFDFAKRSTYFEKTTKNYSNQTELIFVKINKQTANTILEQSILKYINKISYVYKDKNLLQIIKEFYQIIKRKITLIHGKINHLYINTKGLHDGLFLRSILNYSLKLHDKQACIARQERIDGQYLLHKINISDIKLSDKKTIIKKCKEGKDIISAVIETSGFANKNSLRKIIAEGGNLAHIKLALQLFDNFDIALRFLKYINTTNNNLNQQTLTKFIKLAKIKYSEVEIISFLEKTKTSLINDTYNLFTQLDQNYQHTFITAKIKLNKAHDFLVDITNQQKEEQHKKITLKTPQHIINKVAMQLQNHQFYLPTNSLELLKAGQELHNCVSTYTERINSSNKENIVFMADEKGKLLACIRIKNNQVLEAKQKFNKPIYENKTLNSQIIQWCNKAKLQINTQDIKEESTDLILKGA